MISNRVGCYVLLVNDQVVRIFKNPARARTYEGPGTVSFMARKDATERIRRAVYERAGGRCRDCGKAITWSTMQMHEQLPRGSGGEISLTNSVALCHACHQGSAPGSAHYNRRLHFGERT